MKLTDQDFRLDGTTVDKVSEDLQRYLHGLKQERRSVQQIRLTVEELLLNLLTHYGEGMTISVGVGKRFGRHIFRLRYEAEPFDPTGESENSLSDDILRSLGLFPAWSCRGKRNTVSLVLMDRPKRSAMVKILAAIIAAALLGAAGNVIPEGIRRNVTDGILSPAAGGFLGLLNTFAGLMIFFTICNGILNMGDPSSFGRVGKSVLTRFAGISLGISAVTAALSMPFLRLDFSSGAQEIGSPLVSISKMFFDILPGNIVDPFRTGNTFHIIVIAALIGCGLLAFGERGQRIRGLVGEAAPLLQQLVSSVCALIPLFVFSVLVKQIWSGQLGILASALKPILMFFGLTLFLSAALLLLSALRLKCSPLLLLKKVAPTFLVAFTSASSVSALPLGMETCEKKLGIKSSMVSFVYPLGSVIFMPSSVIYFTVIAFTFAEIYQVPVSLPWLVTSVIIVTLIAIALPPIPGGDIIGYSILFSSLGIPEEALLLATALGVLTDYLATGANVALMIFQITSEANRLHCLDRNTLLSRQPTVKKEKRNSLG